MNCGTEISPTSWKTKRNSTWSRCQTLGMAANPQDKPFSQGTSCYPQGANGQQNPAFHASSSQQMQWVRPSSQRKVVLACRNCRDLKKRCNEARPSCGRCIEQGVKCVWDPQRVATKGVSMLELRCHVVALEQTVAALCQTRESQAQRIVDLEQMINERYPSDQEFLHQGARISDNPDHDINESNAQLFYNAHVKLSRIRIAVLEFLSSGDHGKLGKTI